MEESHPRGHSRLSRRYRHQPKRTVCSAASLKSSLIVASRVDSPDELSMTGQCVCAEAFQPQLPHPLQDPDVESLPYAAMPICVCIRIYPALVWFGLVCCCTHSNCNAPTRLMNPSTRSTISHGLRFPLAVRFAPPLVAPLCWARRLAGSGVEPIYREAWRMEERSR